MFWLLIVILCGIVCYLVAMGGLVIAENSVKPPRDECAAILVLGAQVKETGEPSVQLTYRMQTSLEWHRTHPETIIICCGGKGKNEPLAEGDRMREWFIQQGVEETKVFSENKSTNTVENITLAKQYLRNESDPVIVVTSDYHVPRALQIARDCGLDADGLKAETLPVYWLKNHLREVLAWGKYFLKKVF